MSQSAMRFPAVRRIVLAVCKNLQRARPTIEGERTEKRKNPKRTICFGNAYFTILILTVLFCCAGDGLFLFLLLTQKGWSTADRGGRDEGRGTE